MTDSDRTQTVRGEQGFFMRCTLDEATKLATAGCITNTGENAYSLSDAIVERYAHDMDRIFKEMRRCAGIGLGAAWSVPFDHHL